MKNVLVKKWLVLGIIMSLATTVYVPNICENVSAGNGEEIPLPHRQSFEDGLVNWSVGHYPPSSSGNPNITSSKAYDGSYSIKISDPTGSMGKLICNLAIKDDEIEIYCYIWICIV